MHVCVTNESPVIIFWIIYASRHATKWTAIIDLNLVRKRQYQVLSIFFAESSQKDASVHDSLQTAVMFTLLNFTLIG